MHLDRQRVKVFLDPIVVKRSFRLGIYVRWKWMRK